MLIGDPFLYVELGGKKHIVISSMEALRLKEAGDFELHPPEEYGLDELIKKGLEWPELGLQLVSRASASRARSFRLSSL